MKPKVETILIRFHNGSSKQILPSTKKRDNIINKGLLSPNKS